MHRQLQAVDAVTAESLHPNHSQRISRALEVYRQTGVPMSHWRERSQGRSELLFVSHWHRQSDVFFMKGLSFGSIICSPTDSLAKSKRFISVAISRRFAGYRAVGYRQLWSHLSQECSLETARDKGIAATRQLAKRQITWLRGWSGLHWLDSGAKNVQEQVKGQFRNYL